MRQSIGNKIFFVRLGRRGNLFATLSRVVMEGSRGLGKRLERREQRPRVDEQRQLQCVVQL